MKHIGTDQTVVTTDKFDREPTFAELNAIAFEMPVIQAEVELLDAQIIALDRTPNEVDSRRIRRARRKVLVARLAAANLATMRIPGVSA